MDSIDEKILERIAAIQERSTKRGFTQAEAEQATAKLQELLAKHNLSMLDLEKFKAGMAGSVQEQMFMMSARSNWRRELLNQIARANHCRMMFYKGTRYVALIGHNHNIIVAMDMYQWLESIFDDIVTRERTMLKNRSWPQTLFRSSSFEDYFNYDRQQAMYESSRRHLIRNRQSWSNSFRFGMVAGIADAMKKANAKVRAEVGENKWALIPAMDAEVDAYVEAKDAGKDSRKITTYAAARNHGYKVGRDMNVDRPVTSGESGHLALNG